MSLKMENIRSGAVVLMAAWSLEKVTLQQSGIEDAPFSTVGVIFRWEDGTNDVTVMASPHALHSPRSCQCPVGELTGQAN